MDIQIGKDRIVPTLVIIHYYQAFILWLLIPRGGGWGGLEVMTANASLYHHINVMYTVPLVLLVELLLLKMSLPGILKVIEIN